MLSETVLTVPTKPEPSPDLVKVPMVAIVTLLACCSDRAHRGLDGDQKPRGDRTAPLAAAARAEDGGQATLLAREECRLSGRGRKSTDRRCRHAIEAKPTLGKISPSETVWSAWLHRARGEGGDCPGITARSTATE
jgi:hypothetical protein